MRMQECWKVPAERRPSFVRRVLMSAAALTWLLSVVGCDTLLTDSVPAGESLDGAFEGLSPELNAMFARGDEQFARVFTVAEGLGPIFNQPSCESCHPGDGRGTPSLALTRFSRGADLVPELGGDQLQNHSIPGVPPETLPPGVDISVRMPPPVFGVGLIEGIPEETLLALEDPDDADGDGISGRINWVEAADFVPSYMVGAGPGLAVGRFGRKANFSSLLELDVVAHLQDMGITSDFMPEETVHAQLGDVVGDVAPDPEISASAVLDVVMYLRLLTPPNRGEITAVVRSGEKLFMEMNCVSCHVPMLKTGPSPIPQLNQVEAHLYSDLLLHDMGPELADNRPDGSAHGYEWRTPPLFGLRLAGDPLGGTAFYLHDGWTTDLGEAIELHGGEAEAARNGFMALSDTDRKALIAFLMSL